MEQPGPAILARKPVDERVHRFINYLWEAFFLPRHLVVLAIGAVVLTFGILILAKVAPHLLLWWSIPGLIGGAAALEWRYLRQLSRQPAFVRKINAKYQKEIGLFLELEEERQPQQASAPSLGQSLVEGEGRRIAN
jgi:hypothetical protein